MSQYPVNWDLDSFFPGGSQSSELEEFLAQLEADLTSLDQKIAGLKPAEAGKEVEQWSHLLNEIQDISSRLGQAGSFIHCLMSQDVTDEQAKLLNGRITQLSATYGSVMTALDSRFLEIAEADWKKLLQAEELAPISFPLEERRRRAAEKLPPEQETLVGDLSVDGYHAWGDLYSTVVGRIHVPYEEDGKVQQLSVGQAANKMANGDRKVREKVFENWEKAWAEYAELCAAALNHIGGFRLNLYRHRRWDSVLQEPLDYNRMSNKTLDMMWDVIQQNKPRLLQYLQRKAALLGVERLSWHDLYAPVMENQKNVSYDEGAMFILEQFARFDPKLADFSKTALTDGWVEAEDRPGKRPGGFCTSFPLSGQSRIFMTFSGTASNVSTLAHELGHAYHQHVMEGLPRMAQKYAMNVAETASTFAEMIVADASIRHAANEEERLVLLEDKLQRATAFFMDIHTRFLFETRFYEERKQGPVSVGRLNELMTEAQKEAFQGALGEYHPHFWASKLHFYLTSVPFYNFPYTFGYLFSAGIYKRSQEEGPSFAQKYVDLLRDTGRMKVEDLAQHHLGVDLTRPDFWQSAVDVVLADVDQFLEMTESKVKK